MRAPRAEFRESHVASRRPKGSVADTTAPYGRVSYSVATREFHPELPHVAAAELVCGAPFSPRPEMPCPLAFPPQFSHFPIPQNNLHFLQNRQNSMISSPGCTNSSSPPCGCPARHSKHTTYNRKVFIDSKNGRCTNTVVLRHL